MSKRKSGATLLRKGFLAKGLRPLRLTFICLSDTFPAYNIFNIGLIMFFRKLTLGLIIASIFLFSSCAPKTPADFNNEKDIYEYGLQLFEDGKYTEAVSFFETLKNKYPTSPYITDAEFKLGESHFKKGDYIEAIYAFQSFTSLHPTNPNVPTALYRIAVSYFKQIPGSIDRDQTNTTNCINVVEDLSRRYPKFDEIAKADEILTKCKRMLAERELYVANFYLKQKSYGAALGRLETIKNNYDFRDLRQEALYKLALSYSNLKDRDKTIENLTALLGMNPGENYKKKANQLLAKIGQKAAE